MTKTFWAFAIPGLAVFVLVIHIGMMSYLGQNAMSTALYLTGTYASEHLARDRDATTASLERVAIQVFVMYTVALCILQYVFMRHILGYRRLSKTCQQCPDYLKI